MLWIEDELNYDDFIKDKESLYRVMSYGTKYMINGFDGSPPVLGILGRESIPEIKNTTAFRDVGQTLLKYKENGFYEDGGIVADTTFFRIFNYSFIAGNPDKAFKEPFSIVITESMAKKYFADESPIGKVLESEAVDVIVTGVLEDIPKNSTLQFNVVIPFTLYKEINYHFSWVSFMFANFIWISDIANPDSVAKKLTEFAETQKCPQVLDGVSFRLQAMSKVHLDGEHNNWRIFYRSVDKRYIYAFSIIAVFILLIACMNYINLTTARADKRSREVGLRKVSGAERKNIIRQFLGESLLLTFVSLIIALILVELIRPVFNNLTEKELAINYMNPAFIIGVIGIFFITGVIAGSYPAFILSSFNPIRVLKGSEMKRKGGSVFRKVLVVFQFILASVLIIGSLVIFRQINFIRDKDLGFDKEHVVYLPLKENLGKEYKYVKNELLNDPNILSVSAADYLWAMDANRCSGCFRWEGYTDDDEIDVHIPQVDFDYFKTLDIPIIEGRAFSSEYSTDSTQGFMMNESAVKKTGIENALNLPCELHGYNSVIHSGPVIGIFKDIHYRSLHHEIEPQVVRILKNPEDYDSRGVMLVKINGANRDDAIASLEEKWNEVNKLTPFEFHFLDQTYENLYKFDKRTGRIVGYFTILAILISCLGILGLANFMAERKTKEIGIRKVNGASVSSIIWLMTRGFSKWVVIAFIIAAPIAWYFMDKVLTNYAYRIEIGAGIFLLSFALVFFIAFFSVAYQAYRVAIANPVDALRYE